MRQTISGLIAAIAVFAAAPAYACGGLFDGGCSPCNPCAQTYVQPVPTCNTGCGQAAYEALPDPVVQYHRAAPVAQYYYVEQGPTYSGPGDVAPPRVYREEGVYGWRGYHHHHRHHYYGYEGNWHAPRHHHWHHEPVAYRYGYESRPRVLRSYY